MAIPINSLSGIDELFQLLAGRIYSMPAKMDAVKTVFSNLSAYPHIAFEDMFTTAYEDVNIIFDSILDIVMQHTIYEEKDICDLLSLISESLNPTQRLEEQVLCVADIIRAWFSNDTHLCDTILTYAEVHDLI